MEEVLKEYNLKHIDFNNDLEEFMEFYSNNEDMSKKDADAPNPYAVEKSRIKKHLKDEKDKLLKDNNYKIKSTKAKSFLCFIRHKYIRKPPDEIIISEEQKKINELKCKLYDEYIIKEAEKQKELEMISQAKVYLNNFNLQNLKYPNTWNGLTYKFDTGPLTLETQLYISKEIINNKSKVYKKEYA